MYITDLLYISDYQDVKNIIMLFIFIMLVTLLRNIMERNKKIKENFLNH
mgnify:FL=1|jgi:hypothetical protein